MAPSAVWSHFVKLTSKKVKCNVCEKEMSYNQSTTTLANHLLVVHKIQVPKLLNSNKNNEKTTSDNDVTRTVHESGKKEERRINKANDISFSGPMDKCLNNVKAFARGGHREVSVTDSLMYMIAKDGMPLRTVEREGFRHFVQVLQPMYTIPSEPTITKQLEGKYTYLKQKISSKFESLNWICLTTDIWTHKNSMRSYLGLTAHYIDATNLISIEIGAKIIRERKTIPNLRIALREICDDWQITDDKIVAIVSDGGSNIKGAIKEEFGAHKHVSCLAHLINGIGQAVIGIYNYKTPSEENENSILDLPENEDDLADILDCVENAETRQGEEMNLKELIIKVKKIVSFFRSSSVATDELIKLQAHENEKSENESLKLIQEVRTRWNSCYDMLERFINLSDFVSRVLLQLQRERNTRRKPPNMLSFDELDVLTEVRDLLKPLEQVTKELSSEKNVTLSKAIPLILNLKKKTEKHLGASEIGRKLREKILTEIENRFSKIELVQNFAAATILDPRFKKPAFQNPLGYSYALSFVGKLVMEEIEKNRVSLQLNVIQENLEYSKDDFWQEFDEVINNNVEADQDVAGGIPIELRQYANRPPVSRQRNPNPLKVWETLKGEYPHVQKVAEQFLTILATSVPSERLFSHAGLIANQLRTRLSPMHLDMLLFLKSADESLWSS